LLAELGGLRTPNAEGCLPLADLDPARPNEAYFALVDWVLERGAEKGLCWDSCRRGETSGTSAGGRGPEVFTAEKARVYGAGWDGAIGICC